MDMHVPFSPTRLPPRLPYDTEQSSLYSRALSVSTLNTALCACGPQTSLAALGSTLTVGVPCFLTWGPSLTAVDARCNWITTNYANHCLNLFFVFKLCLVSPRCSMTLSALLISCLIYKTVVSCSNQCVFRPPIKVLWLNILRKITFLT